MAAFGNELSRLVDELNRSKAATVSGGSFSIDRLLTLAAQRGASDIVLVAGSAIALRVKGSLTPAAGKPLSSEDIRGLLMPLLTARQAEELEGNKSLDFCFARGQIGRFRANFHYQRGTSGGEHSPAACADPNARIVAPAGGAGPAGGTATRLGVAHGPDRLWQDVNLGCAA